MVVIVWTSRSKQNYQQLTITGSHLHCLMIRKWQVSFLTATLAFWILSRSERSPFLFYSHRDLPVVQLYPNTSVFNITEGSPKFVFTGICNVHDANPVPQPDNYSSSLEAMLTKVKPGHLMNFCTFNNLKMACISVWQRNSYGTGNSSTVWT